MRIWILWCMDKWVRGFVFTIMCMCACVRVWIIVLSVHHLCMRVCMCVCVPVWFIVVIVMCARVSMYVHAGEYICVCCLVIPEWHECCCPSLCICVVWYWWVIVCPSWSCMAKGEEPSNELFVCMSVCLYVCLSLMQAGVYVCGVCGVGYVVTV